MLACCRATPGHPLHALSRPLLLQVAPFDVLVADERLPAEEVAATRAAMEYWKLEHAYAMLPYSTVIFESVPEDSRPRMPEHRKRGPSA